MILRELDKVLCGDVRISLYVGDYEHPICITENQWYGGLAPYWNNEIRSIAFADRSSFVVDMQIVLKEGYDE